MKKILALALFAVALVSCRQTMQTDGFKLSGHLEGLQVGDTLFLKTFLRNYILFTPKIRFSFEFSKSLYSNSFSKFIVISIAITV